MKVILLEDVKALGKKGQVVNVSDGYARNLLLPKKLGVEATGKNMNDLKLKKANDDKIAQQQHMDKIEDIKGVQNEIAWGHQIRSYVFMPYTMVKDHRTNYETGNVDAVMDGDLDGFIFAYLKAASRGELQDT